VPTDLDGIVWRAVAREPRDRFATAADFAEAIERCSVRPATVREVAAYVDTLLGATLQARRARLAGYATASLPLPPAEADAAPSTGEQDTLTATSPVDPAERHEAAMSPAHDLGAYPDTTVEPTTPFVATAAAALRPRSRRAHWILGAAALAVASVLIANTIRSRSARHEPGVAVRTGTPPTVVAPVPAATAPIAVAPTAPAPERREPSPLPTAPTITHTPPSYSHHESIRRTPHAPAARPPSTAPPTPPPQQEFHPRVL
jgi:serine/threonine-protein kinase